MYLFADRLIRDLAIFRSHTSVSNGPRRVWFDLVLALLNAERPHGLGNLFEMRFLHQNEWSTMFRWIPYMNPNNYRAARPRLENRTASDIAQLRQDIQEWQRLQHRPKPATPLQRAPRTLPKGPRPRPLQPNRPGPSHDLTARGRDGGDSLSSVSSAYSRGFSSQKASFSVTNDGIRIRKRELLDSITGTVGFTVAKTYAINPGIIPSFPWLSTQAAGWEQYKFHKLRYCYYTRTGSGTPGSCMLVPDYDAADPPPTSEQQAMDYKDAKEEVPWVVEFSCELNPSAMHPAGARKFIRQNLVAGTDIKTYDAGNMFIITTDGTAVTWGKIFVEYDVEFFCSQLPIANFVGASFTGSSNAAPFATQTGNLQVSAVSTGTTTSVTTFTFNQAFTGLLSASVVGTVLTAMTSGGTAAVQIINSIVDSGALNDVAIFKVDAQPGQTFVLTIPNTTISTTSLSLTFRNVAPL